MGAQNRRFLSDKQMKTWAGQSAQVCEREEFLPGGLEVPEGDHRRPVPYIFPASHVNFRPSIHINYLGAPSPRPSKSCAPAVWEKGSYVMSNAEAPSGSSGRTPKAKAAEPETLEMQTSEPPPAHLPAQLAERPAKSGAGRQSLAWFTFSLERNIERMLWFILLLLAAAV
jgi:hypothetical protein